MTWIRAAGFNGIVTLGSAGSLQDVPSIAHAAGWGGLCVSGTRATKTN